MSWPCLGLRLLLLALGTPGEQEKKPVPVYTNDDLDRISPFRHETGVTSKPAVAKPATTPGRQPEDGRRQSEEFWRREADRLAERLQRSRDRIEDLRGRIAASEAQSGRRSREARTRGAAQIEAWERQIGAMEARIRESEAALADRARRAGALPGWLR